MFKYFSAFISSCNISIFNVQSNDEITYLCFVFAENNINNFMSFYRENWPSSSVTPKLHILEDHVTQFIRTWGIGLGFMGEQGFESIHSNFNLRQAEQRGAVSAVQRLERIMKRHLMAVHPENAKLKPVIKKRKFN